MVSHFSPFLQFLRIQLFLPSSASAGPRERSLENSLNGKDRTIHSPSFPISDLAIFPPSPKTTYKSCFHSSTHLTLLSPPLADLCRETRLDSRDGTPGAARVAGNEVQAVLALVELGIGRPTRLAGHVLDNVAAQHVLDLLLLEAALNDEAAGAVDGTRGTQFGEQELCDVLLGTLHALGDLGDVGEDGL